MPEPDLTQVPGRAHQIEGLTRPFFVVAEVIVYVLIGLTFLGAAVGMLGYSIVNFVATLQTSRTADPFPIAIVTLINDLLLVMIIMEVLRTIVSYLQEQGTSLQPFLFIAAISATRRVLAIGAQMSVGGGASGAGGEAQALQFQQAMIDLGVNAAAILVIAVALYLLNRNRALVAASRPDAVPAFEERLGPTAPSASGAGAPGAAGEA